MNDILFSLNPLMRKFQEIESCQHFKKIKLVYEDYLPLLFEKGSFFYRFEPPQNEKYLTMRLIHPVHLKVASKNKLNTQPQK